MFLLLHSGDVDWSKLFLTVLFLAVTAIVFLAIIIWMTAQTILGFKEDARRRAIRLEEQSRE